MVNGLRPGQPVLMSQPTAQINEGPIASEYSISAVAAEALRSELAELRRQKDHEIAERLRDARGFGDGADNDELMAIREEEAVLDARIATLERFLRRARVLDGKAQPGIATIGSVVTVEDLATGKSERYSVVGMHQQLEAGQVSAGSPIGQALLGRRVGELATALLPNGRCRSFEIASIELAGPMVAAA